MKQADESKRSFIVEITKISAMSASGTLGIDKWSHSELGTVKLLNLTRFVLSFHSVSFWLRYNL